ncbi:MAG: bifunctional phosphoglucose/phosphomannose isomerase, partial [Acidimicrobiaceae bacterium]|nr:bifunctional phosphoglucose/phosphomannose isomerase [Acidimicrobiaceae bacterium]
AAAQRGASVVVVLGGARLEALSHESGWPLLTRKRDPRSSRADLAAVLPGALLAAERFGALVDGAVSESIVAAARQLEARSAQPPDRSSALAARIGRTIPLIEGARGVGAVAAMRWKSLVNARAKSLAIAAGQPVASVEEVSGFGQNGDVTRQLVTLVLLRTPGDLPADVLRLRVGAELTEEALAGVLEIEASGDGPLAHLLDLEWTGNALADALAAREDLDPGPAPAADAVRARLYTSARTGRERVCG